MTISKVGLIGYVIFLAVYSVYKYSVAAPAEFSLVYAQSVAILVAMTGVAPFLLAYIGLKTIGVRGVEGSVWGLLIGLVACVGGYAAFWWFFIAPEGAAPAVYDVALRGVGWGLLQGGLASVTANH